MGELSTQKPDRSNLLLEIVAISKFIILLIFLSFQLPTNLLIIMLSPISIGKQKLNKNLIVLISHQR